MIIRDFRLSPSGRKLLAQAKFFSLLQETTLKQRQFTVISLGIDVTRKIQDLHSCNGILHTDKYPFPFHLSAPMPLPPCRQMVAFILEQVRNLTSFLH